MNEKRTLQNKVFLIAGSEPLGAAGMQTDIKCITACGGYAAGALTCIVDEDTTRVKDIFMLPVPLVLSQTVSFLDDVGANCIKTGMLYSKELIEGLAEILRRFPDMPKVIDPVMVNSKGVQLLKKEAVESYKSHLFPLATLITPNKREAEILLGRSLNSADILSDLKELTQWGNAVIVKSADFQETVTDYYYNPASGEFKTYRKAHIVTTNVNGSGDVFSSAIATFLARGFQLTEAIDKAEAFITEALKLGAGIAFGSNFGPALPIIPMNCFN